MLHKLKVVPSCLIAVVLAFGFASLTQAADSRVSPKTDSAPQQSQPESTQPQQAAPSQPKSETEPVDSDDTQLC
ncbi:MAG: hypothetical protein QM709_04745 [Spongiibacteraceae bacterium]